MDFQKAFFSVLVFHYIFKFCHAQLSSNLSIPLQALVVYCENDKLTNDIFETTWNSKTLEASPRASVGFAK